MQLGELETPTLVLDRITMDRNIARLAKRLADFGVVLRPHVKTNKSADVAKRIGAPGSPITVSTLKEAEYFFEHGWTDILYAVGIAANKFAHIARLTQRGARMTVVLDNVETASALAAFCRDNALTLAVLIEIDTDGHRSGVLPGDPALLNIAALLGATQAAAGAWLAGVMTHAGASYDCESTADIEALTPWLDWAWAETG